ncbi:siderophore ferric iron reductase [Vibrio sp.]|nr:siderophore ferric iron reductase [Vibrio sp.]
MYEIDSDITPKFIALIQRYIPSMKGELRDPTPSDICFLNDNSIAIHKLSAHIKDLHPEAGESYAIVRSWGTIIWQPVVLAIAATHGMGMELCQTHMGQHIENGSAAKYSLSKDSLNPPLWRDRDKLILSNAHQLKSCMNHYLIQTVDALGIRQLEAKRLLADRVLSSLLSFNETLLRLDNDELIYVANLWLNALDLAGQSALMKISLNNGTDKITLNRKGCCLHFRTKGGDLCATCPRQKQSIRIKRLQEIGNGHA